jgi:hypothetical protein
MHYVAAYKEIAFISDFPAEIHRNERGLHSDAGAALLYRDTYSLYSFNGITVPEKLVTTSAKDLVAREWLKESNVDIRREAFRKIGIDKVVLDLGGKVIDTLDCPKGGRYELLMVDIGLKEPRPYLKMRNQSIGEYHVEGVPSGTETCMQALAWRVGMENYVQPVALT